LYVKWLHDLNAVHFKTLIKFLIKGNTVEEAMVSSYGFTVSNGWELFVDEIKTQRIRIDRESEANHDLILWLDEPAGI
jgi:hypothetical protein